MPHPAKIKTALLTMALTCLACTTRADTQFPMDPQAVALMPVRAETADARFFALIDLDSPGLDTVRDLVGKQQYVRALDAWRNYVVLKLRRRKAGLFGWHGNVLHPRSRAWADRLIGDESAAELNDVMNLTGPPSEDRKINWITKEDVGQLQYYAGFRGFNYLIGQYQQTRNPIYLRKWFEITDAFVVENKRQEKALPPEERKEIMTNWDLRSHGETLSAASRVHNILKSLAYFAKALPDGRAPRNWNSEAMLPIETELAPGAINMIGADQLADVAISLYADHAPFLLGAYEKFGRTPNQRFSGLTALAMTAYALDEFKASGPLMKRAGAALEDYVKTTVLPDGGDLEQSFNYNQNFVKEGREAVEVFPEGERPHWVEVLEDAVLRRERLFAGVATPFAGLPRIGTHSALEAPVGWRETRSLPPWKKRAADGLAAISGDPLAKRIYDCLLGSGEQQQPDFTSIAFPYSGYYAMRDGWKMTSHYLWFIGSRNGTGHRKENINGIAVAAYGRPLLTDNGPPPYGPQFLPDSQRSEYEEVLKYFGERSSLAHNTILVDMQSQGRHNVRGVRQAYDQPIASRWHTSERYDFAESRYEDGYGEGDHTSAVKHYRHVVFLRQLGLWLVTDRLVGDGKLHAYQQMWHFPPPHVQWTVPSPGFTDDQVITDSAANIIRTNDLDGPNIALHQFAPGQVTCKRYFGQRNPWLGWYAIGIGGERIPSVDVHTTWEADGDSIVTTALVPSPDNALRVRQAKDLSRVDDAVAGCELLVGDATVTWLAAQASATLQIGDLSATAEELLLVEHPEQALTGIALGVTLVTMHGKPVKQAPHDFEFSIENGALKVVAPIKYPDTPDVLSLKPDHGLFLQPVEVTPVLPPRPGAELYCTTDGSEPTATSSRCVEPVKIEATTDLTVRPFRNGTPSGPSVRGHFEVRDLPPVPPMPQVHLSDLDPASFKGEAFDLGRDKCCYQGTPLKLAGKTYEKGISVHAKATIVYALRPQYRRFVATVGLDDVTGAKGNVIVRALADGKLLTETPLIEGVSQRFWYLACPLPREAKQLQITVDPGPYSGGWHMVDFVNAGFTVAD